MTGIRETLEDIAGEITPAHPPVELTMLRGRRKRNGRRAAAIAGGAGVLALAFGAALAIPALGSRPAPAGTAAAPGAASAVKPGDVPIARPVLLLSRPGISVKYGDPSLVNAATMRLFDRLTCRPGANAHSVSDSWKASVGYTANSWNAPDGQVVSCDAAGNKYVLGKAVIFSTQVTSATPTLQQSNGQWYVDVRLNHAATTAFGRLTTSQYNSHYLRVSRSGGADLNDAVLASTAIVTNGDVRSAPITTGPITFGLLQISGPQPGGFTTQAQAAALAAQL